MPKDFGYFGKGLTGYVHYMQAFNRNNGGKPPSGRKSGCATTTLLCLLLFLAAVRLL